MKKENSEFLVAIIVILLVSLLPLIAVVIFDASFSAFAIISLVTASIFVFCFDECPYG